MKLYRESFGCPPIYYTSLEEFILDGWEIWSATESGLVNTWVTFFNFEVTRFTPGFSPWVGADPVFNATFFAPTDDFHGVTSLNTTGNVGIDTTSVVEEVTIDGESGFNWAWFLNELLGGFSSSGLNGRAILALVFLDSRAISTLSWAWFNSSFAWSVWLALVSGNTILFEVLPWSIEVTTVASVISLVARDHVLWGKNNVNATTRSNTESVWKSFWSTESPARAAWCLVSNIVDTTRPFLSWIEGCSWGYWLSLESWDFTWAFNEGSEESLKLLVGIVSKWVLANFHWDPKSISWFDFGNHFLADWVSSGEDCSWADNGGL